jgi:16S rRNA C967 or C1407 C5-methylase (RsmB/RsmF family)
MAELELAIVKNVAPLVRPGGLLCVATCSFAVAEGPELATRIERAVPGLTRVVDDATDPDGVTRLGPWSEPARALDCYQLVRFRVQGPAGP